MGRVNRKSLGPGGWLWDRDSSLFSDPILNRSPVKRNLIVRWKEGGEYGAKHAMTLVQTLKG
jgi:hypothetical protein